MRIIRITLMYIIFIIPFAIPVIVFILFSWKGLAIYAAFSLLLALLRKVIKIKNLKYGRYNR